MTFINFDDVSVIFPLRNKGGRAFRRDREKNNDGYEKANSIAQNVSEGGRSVAGLSEVSFYISPGERVGLLGKNGSGKTTLLRSLCGIYPPTQGKIIREGSVFSMLDIYQGFDDSLTGRENIEIKGMLSGRQTKEIKAAEEGIIQFSELDDFIDLPLKVYSAGMRMRLSFSIATSFSPDILVMDEWLSTGDTTFKKKARSRLQNFVSESSVLVLASHNIDILQKVCNRGIILSNGSVLYDGYIDEAIKLYREVSDSDKTGVILEREVSEACKTVPIPKVERSELSDNKFWEIVCKDLANLKDKVHAFREINGEYPINRRKWASSSAAIESKFGCWMPGMGAGAENSGPFHPEGRYNPFSNQYLYASNGVDYKLIAQCGGRKVESNILEGYGLLIDPVRKSRAVGYFSDGYQEY